MKRYIPLVIILLSVCISSYLYPQLPDVLATHWGADGRVNGYSGKLVALFIMPFISTILYLLFLFLPSIDPYKKNFSQFRTHFDNFVIIIITFLFYIYILTLAWHLGYQYSMIRFLTPAFAVLFFYTGTLLSVAKRNWFVGIRTPWTMSSDKVWDQTHQLGAKLFKVSAIISLFGLAFSDLAFYFLIVPLISSTVFIFFYSYYIYSKK